MIHYAGGIRAARTLPKAKGKRPAVIILHERYGIDQHTKDLGWLNDAMPGRYRQEPAKDAWNLIISFLKKCFAGWNQNRIICTYQSDFSTQYDFSKNVRME